MTELNFFNSDLQFFFCFSLKMRPRCLFRLCPSSSLSCEVMWLVPSAIMFLFSESGIITLWQQLWLKEVLYVGFFFTHICFYFFNEYSLNWYEYLYFSRETKRDQVLGVGLGKSCPHFIFKHSCHNKELFLRPKRTRNSLYKKNSAGWWCKSWITTIIHQINEGGFIFAKNFKCLRTCSEECCEVKGRAALSTSWSILR